MSGELAGAGYAEDVEMFYDRVPKGEVELDRASLVTSSDGHGLGRVEAFIVDDEDKVTHFVLERSISHLRKCWCTASAPTSSTSGNCSSAGWSRERIGLRAPEAAV